MAAYKYIRVIEFKQTGPFSLLLKFNDGLEREIDFLPALKGDLYKPLRNPEYFKRVALNDEIGIIEWPNEADFNSQTLHDWPEHLEAYKNWNPRETEDACETGVIHAQLAVA